MNLLQVSGISVKKNNGFVLKDISFTQHRFEKIAIAGETGSGKSTLLKIIAGAGHPDAGIVTFNQERVPGMAEKLIPGHPGIAWLSQYFELPKFLTVEQVLSYANELPENQANSLYDICRIRHLVKRRTDQLSGGEKQRIALARLLTTSPKLLLLDEPFSNLDLIHKNILQSVIQDIGDQLAITCIMVIHDPLDTLSWANKIMIMKDGQIIQKGSPAQIYKHPVNEYAAGLFGKYNIIHPRQAAVLSSLPGIGSNGKKMFIRPENLQVTNEASDGFSGLVTKIRFFGVYYELDVMLAEQQVLVATQKTGMKPGDTIRMSVQPSDIGYL